MSGLVGWIDFHRDLRAHTDVVAAMTETMLERGPRAGGVWTSRHAALGHRRGPALAATSPPRPARASVGGQTVVAACIGQIYNAAEVRRQLGTRPAGGRGPARPPRDPTADLLVDAYLRWGDALAERLRGMFAFAVWDERTRRLLLGRDQLGLKPMYYAEYPGGLLFASTPRGIMANRLFTPRLHPAAVPILLQPRLTLAGETPLVGLRELRPGHVATFTEDGLSTRRYWGLTAAPHTETFDETARHVRELLEDAVTEQVAGLGSGAAMLSGGVDSTAVAALATRAFEKADPDLVLDTFCLQFDSDPAHFVPTELRPDVDAPYAAAAAEFIGTRHSTLNASLTDLLGVIPATRRARGLPGWGQFDASMYLLFQRIRAGHLVALTGEAADEIFGGYPYLFRADLTTRPDFPWLGDGPRLSDYLSGELVALVDPHQDARARYWELVSQVPRLPGEDTDEARMRTVLFLGMSGPLSVIIDRKERMSAGQGLEVRFPFCDHRLVDYVWNVPWALKSTGGAKGLLKAAVADVLPPGTLARRKSAYPHVQNPEYDAALLAEAMRIVNDRESPTAWMFDTARMNELIRTIGNAGLTSMLPGGSSGAQMLIQLVETNQWISDYGVVTR
jgi:asparagine synthase (glutamine-hydrolysing)